MTDWRTSTNKGGHTRGGRTVDMQTGGIIDDLVADAQGGYDMAAGAWDHILGSTDEAVGRTFDDEQGGGIFHGIAETLPLMSQPEEVTDRQIDEGILDESAGERGDVAASDASIKASDNAAPPGGTAVQVVRVRNGLANVASDNPNRRQTDKQDAISPEGAIIGIGTAAAGAAAAGASLGSVAGPPGAIVGGVAAGTGSLLAAAVEEFVGALGYTVTAFIDDEAVGQTVASVGVPAAGVGSNGRDIQLEHTVPDEPGQYTVNIVVSMWQTGQVVNTMEVDLTVEEGRSSNTVSNDNGQDDNNDRNETLNWAINNPVKSAGIGFTGLVVARTVAETAVAGE